MSDHTSDGFHVRRHSRDRTAEYWFYFSLIFLFALPFAFAQWLRDSASGRQAGRPGVVHRARNEAHVITPMIFSA